MKKMALFAALMLGSAAVAQTTTGTMTDQSTTTTTTMPTTDQTTTDTTTSTTDTTMTTPATDATAPTTSTMAMPSSGNMTAAPVATGDYPRCSRTVTDHCKQSSARESDYKGGPAKHRRR